MGGEGGRSMGWWVFRCRHNLKHKPSCGAHLAHAQARSDPTFSPSSGPQPHPSLLPPHLVWLQSCRLTRATPRGAQYPKTAALLYTQPVPVHRRWEWGGVGVRDRGRGFSCWGGVSVCGRGGRSAAQTSPAGRSQATAPAIHAMQAPTPLPITSKGFTQTFAVSTCG